MKLIDFLRVCKFRGCTDNVCEWLEDRKNGRRKVSHYYVDMNKLYIALE